MIKSREILFKTIRQLDFSRLFIVLPTGQAYDESGMMVDVSDQDFFKRAAAGETVIADTPADGNGRQVCHSDQCSPI